jgi:YggT family protein
MISKPFIEFFLTIIDLYRYVLIAWIIMSWMKAFNLINEYSPVIQKIMTTLNRLTSPVLDYIRKYVPPFGGLDLSSLILLLLIGFAKSLLMSIYL